MAANSELGFHGRAIGSVSSGDASDKSCGSYSPSVDIISFKTSSNFSGSHFTADTSSSLASSPSPQAAEAVAEIITSDLILWKYKLEKQQHFEISKVEMINERFVKVLLGEDMSGGVKGIYTALIVSDAITYLSATVFGELWQLELLTAQKKMMWR